MKEDFISVSQLNKYVKDYLDDNYSLRNLYVRGEVLNIKYYPRQAYFTLKDQNDSKISAVMFLNAKLSQNKFKDGDDIVVFGQVSLYEKTGTYQLIVTDGQYYGQGAKLLALQKLKEKLAKTGIFDEKNKLKIPKFSYNIAVIAGKDSAAWADIKTNITRRFPIANIFFFPCLVQGQQASKDIISAYKTSLTYNPDLIIIARGGGSSDDLWAFNDEELVNVLATRTIPLISAVGHEIDTTLVDYVADLRVSTPTAAAEKATVNVIDIKIDLANANLRLSNALNVVVKYRSEKLNHLMNLQVLKAPQNIITPKLNHLKDLKYSLATIFQQNYNSLKNTINEYVNRLDNALNSLINTNSTRFNLVSSKFDGLMTLYIDKIKTRVDLASSKIVTLSPDNILKRGYAIVLDKNSKVIRDVTSLKQGDKLTTRLYKQTITSTVEEAHKDE